MILSILYVLWLINHVLLFCHTTIPRHKHNQVMSEIESRKLNCLIHVSYYQDTSLHKSYLPLSHGNNLYHFTFHLSKVLCTLNHFQNRWLPLQLMIRNRLNNKYQENAHASKNEMKVYLTILKEILSYTLWYNYQAFLIKTLIFDLLFPMVVHSQIFRLNFVLQI